MDELKPLIEKNLVSEIGQCQVEDLSLFEDYGDIQFYRLLYLYSGEVINRAQFEKNELEGATEFEVKYNALLQSVIQVDFNERVILMETNKVNTYFDDQYKILKKEDKIEHIDDEEIIEFLKGRMDYAVKDIQDQIGLPHLNTINF